VYAFHLLRNIDFTAFNAGSAVPTLNRNHIHSLPTLQPRTDLIEAFERFAAAALARKGSAEKEVSALAALRDTLLPRLISGDLRVKDAETFLDRVL
jgi:type I restriction enzyme, S subunit